MPISQEPNVPKKTDPWLEQNSENSHNQNLEFDDAFTTFETDKTDRQYKPLDDSKDYLANLEKKLNKIQCKDNRPVSRKQLLDALCQTKDDHVRRYINSEEPIDTSINEDQISSRTIDPEGSLGQILRRVAPDKVAVSAEELCELLKADILQKQYAEINENNDDQQT